MANRYWVGGTATWDLTAGTKWATTDGGAGGASVPTTSDDVFFTAASGTVTCTLASFRTAKSINCTGFTGTIAGTGSATVAGSVTLVAGMSYTHTGTITFTGTGTITTAGKTFGGLTINGSGITVQLADALNCLVLTLTQGTFTTNDYAVTCSAFSSSNSNTRTLNMGASAWTITGTGTCWSVITTTNMTLNKGSANILLSNNTTTPRTFAGGAGLSYNKLTIGGTSSTSTTTITSGQFTELDSTKTVAHVVQLGANVGTIDTWSVKGTLGNVVTFQSNLAGTQRTFALTNITSGIDYLKVKDINCTTANKFYVGANSEDNGNNTNVIFTAAPSASNSNFFLMFA